MLTAILCGIGVGLCHADEILPRLIFTGNAEESKILSLDEFNRIKFGDDSMLVSSTADPTNVIELPYSDYHMFSVGEDVLTGVEEISGSDNLLTYDSASSSLRLDAPSNQTYVIRIYNIYGMSAMTAEIRGGESIDLLSLERGVHIAVATGENGIRKIKFMK